MTGTAQNSQEDVWLVSCRCESAKSISDLLNCLQHVAFGNAIGHSDLTQTKKRQSLIQPVTVFCSKKSLTFHVSGRAKQTQASVDMQAGLFSEYRVAEIEGGENHDDEDWQSGGEFCINLLTLLDCINILGGPNLERTKFCFSYNETQETFKLEMLDDSGILSTATIPGMLTPAGEQNYSLAHAFRQSPTACRILLKSEVLREAMKELEVVQGATSGTVSLGKDCFEIAVVGHIGETMISIPTVGAHVVSMNAFDGPPTVRSYPLHSLLGSMHGLEIANETCITLNQGGMLAMQHQILDDETGDSNPSYVDYIMCCLEEDLEMQNDEEEGHSQSLRTQTQYTMPTETQDVQSTSRSYVAASSVASHSHFEEYEDDSEPEYEAPSVSAQPLFGTITRDAPKPTSQKDRSVRQRSQTTDRIVHDSEFEHELPSPSRPVRDDEDAPSSPEIVYGRQH